MVSVIDKKLSEKEMKLRVSDYLKGRTKWGADPSMEVSFQTFKDEIACYQGDGSVPMTMGWGKDEQSSIINLLKRMIEYDKHRFF